MPDDLPALVRPAGFLIGRAQAVFPTNYLVRWVYTDRGLKWGVPIAVVLVPSYYHLGHVFQANIAAGGSEWWNLALLWSLINCIKFISMGIRTPFAWVYRFSRGRYGRWQARRAAAVPAQW